MPQLLETGPERVLVKYGSIGKGGLLYELPRLIAADQGFFDARGIDIETVEFGGSTSQTAALIVGEIDVANAGPTAPIDAMVQGAELGVFGPWFPLNYMLVTFNDGRPTPDPFPASMEYFVGQSVGVPSLGGPGHLFVLAMLREAGIAEEAVTFVTSGAPAGWVPVVQAGQITAGVLTPNGIALFEQHDIEVTVLADPLHGNGGETIEGVAAVVMAARAPFIDDSQVFGRFCAAMTEAVDWISEPANRHAGVAVFANHLELPPDLVGNLWDAEAGLFRKQIGERDWMANVAWTTNGDSQLPYADFVHTR